MVTDSPSTVWVASSGTSTIKGLEYEDCEGQPVPRVPISATLVDTTPLTMQEMENGAVPPAQLKWVGPHWVTVLGSMVTLKADADAAKDRAQVATIKPLPNTETISDWCTGFLTTANKNGQTHTKNHDTRSNKGE